MNLVSWGMRSPKIGAPARGNDGKRKDRCGKAAQALSAPGQVYVSHSRPDRRTDALRERSLPLSLAGAPALAAGATAAAEAFPGLYAEALVREVQLDAFKHP